MSLWAFTWPSHDLIVKIHLVSGCQSAADLDPSSCLHRTLIFNFSRRERSMMTVLVFANCEYASFYLTSPKTGQLSEVDFN
jgi:hypothetical protein